MLQNDTGGKGGNNKPSPLRSKNTMSRKWIMTINNWKEEEKKCIIDTCYKKNWKFIVGEEVGEEKGTPHLQCYIESKHAIRFNTLQKLFPRGRLEKARGSREDNWKYCSKDGIYTQNGVMPFREALKLKILTNEYKNIKWKPWQQKILDNLPKKPNRRIINWLWDSRGNCGKSYLSKYIGSTFKGVIIADGKKDNVFNQINKMMEDEIEPKIIIIDVPRHNINYVNYGLIEEIKNGDIYSGKYEGGKCSFEIPHVYIFANSPPIKDRLSEDRWNIVNLDKDDKEEVFSDITYESTAPNVIDRASFIQSTPKV